MPDKAQLAKKFPEFKESELEDFCKKFEAIDVDKSGLIDTQEVLKACHSSGMNPSFDEVLKALREVDENNKSGTVDLEQYLHIVANVRKTGAVCRKPSAKIIRTTGATDSTQHSINQEEKEQFTHHINQVLKIDKDIGSRFPIDPCTNDIFAACKDGLLLSKLINDSVPETIDERVLNMGPKINPFQMTENNNLVINSAKAIGCSVVNIGSQDLIEERQHLILGLIWQIIKIGLLSKISLQFHPELYRLLEKGETLETFLKLPAETILLRWFNFHLREANSSRKVTNFSSDLMDSENYIVLLHQLCPGQCNLEALSEKDLTLRAELMLKSTERIGCRRYITPKSVVAGNPKLNLAFVANLFNLYPGLAPLSKEELAAIDEGLFGAQGDREARAFALWLNSLGVEPMVNNLYSDLFDGIVLLQAFDKVRPKIVNWSRVNQKVPLIRFKAIENTNYAVELGKQLKFSLVGIQGADISDGVKNLTLGLVWQLMREHVLVIIKSLSKDGKDITEAEMIAWANKMVSNTGKNLSMSSFKDPSLGTSVFFLHLLNALKPETVNFNIVTPGLTEKDAKSNAKYAISIARKLGATIFLLPEDIIEVKPKMILTFIGALMAVHVASK